jgi:hypothetical protein
MKTPIGSSANWHATATGDLGQTVAGLVHAHESLECFADEVEEVRRASLLAQLERSERDYREGRFVTWDEAKRRLGL